MKKAQRKATEMTGKCGLTSCKELLRERQGVRGVCEIVTGLEEVNGKGLCTVSSKTKAEQQQVKSGFTLKVKRRRGFCHVRQLSLEVLNVRWFIGAVLHLHQISY